MPALTKLQLRQHLKSKSFEPVYTLYGPEAYLRDVAAKTIVDMAFGEGELRDFNEDVFSLNEPSSLKAALAAADQLPMMAAKRVVRVTDVRVAATTQKDTLREEFETQLEAYLANPAPQTILLFVADELNGNRKLGKLLKGKTAAVEFEQLQGSELNDWVVRTAVEFGAKIDRRTADYLTLTVGADLRRLYAELKKIATAAMPEAMITIEHIDELVSNTSEIPNFDLTDHLVAGRGQQALAALKKILDDGAEPLALLGLISYNFRRLLIAKDMMDSGAERAAVAKAAGLRYSDQEVFFAAARRTEAAKLIRILARLAQTDLAIKTSLAGGGKQGSRMQIEMLVCELAAG